MTDKEIADFYQGGYERGLTEMEVRYALRIKVAFDEGYEQGFRDGEIKGYSAGKNDGQDDFKDGSSRPIPIELENR